MWTLTPTLTPGVVHKLFWTSSRRAKNEKKSIYASINGEQETRDKIYFIWLTKVLNFKMNFETFMNVDKLKKTHKTKSAFVEVVQNKKCICRKTRPISVQDSLADALLIT